MVLMIVDDERQIRSGLAQTIDWKEYGIDKVVEGESSAAVLEYLKVNKIDIIISDIKMPGMNGIELAEYVRKIYPSIKIIFLTGYADFEYARCSIKIGINEYLLKPVRINELTDVVKRMCLLIKQEKAEKNCQSYIEGEKISWFIENCKDYIYENYAKDITLADLSLRVWKNQSYVSHIFKKELGKGFSEFLNEVRINKAIELLSRSNMHVYEIAECVGFNDYRYFISIFKKITGKSPSEYRNHKVRDQ